jgi:hypothetical protein
MALITIGGVVVPTPSDYQVSIMDISKAERMANGTMKIDRVTTKRKIELQWNYLSRADLAIVLNAVSAESFAVVYLDPQTNTYVSDKLFYCGDRSAGMLDFFNSVPRYRDIKFNLIEL